MDLVYDEFGVCVFLFSDGSKPPAKLGYAQFVEGDVLLEEGAEVIVKWPKKIVILPPKRMEQRVAQGISRGEKVEFEEKAAKIMYMGTWTEAEKALQQYNETGSVHGLTKEERRKAKKQAPYTPTRTEENAKKSKNKQVATAAKHLKKLKREERNALDDISRAKNAALVDQVTKALEQRRNPEGQTDRSKNKADNNRNLAETLDKDVNLLTRPKSSDAKPDRKEGLKDIEPKVDIKKQNRKPPKNKKVIELSSDESEKMSGEDSSDTQSDDDEPSNDSTSSSVASIKKDSSFSKRKLSTDNDRAVSPPSKQPKSCTDDRNVEDKSPEFGFISSPPPHSSLEIQSSKEVKQMEDGSQKTGTSRFSLSEEWMTFFTKENLQILDALVEETKRKMSKKQQKREKRIVKKSIINFLNGKDEDVDFTSIPKLEDFYPSKILKQLNDKKYKKDTKYLCSLIDGAYTASDLQKYSLTGAGEGKSEFPKDVLYSYFDYIKRHPENYGGDYSTSRLLDSFCYKMNRSATSSGL